MQYKLQIIRAYHIEKERSVSLIEQGTMTKQQQITVKYLFHKNLYYIVKNNTLFDLKYKPLKTFNMYCEEGLTADQLERNTKIYGKATKLGFGYLTGFKKIMLHNKLRSFFMLLSLKKVIFGLVGMAKSDEQFQTHQNFTTLLIGSQVIITLLIMLALSLKFYVQQNKLFKQLDYKTKYNVIRSGQQQEVLLSDIIVGDLIKVSIKEIIYFQGILVTNHIGEELFAIVNEKLHNQINQPKQKYAITSHINEIFDNNVIKPGTKIWNLGVVKQSKESMHNITSQQQLKRSQSSDQSKKKQHFIIVTDNKYIQKYFDEYRNSETYETFSPLRQSYDQEHLIFGGVFLILSLLMVLWATHLGEGQQIVDLILTPIILCFPYNMLFLSLINDIVSLIRLNRHQGINVVNPTIQQMGICQSLSLDMSGFQQLQFSGFLKKQRSFGMQMPDRFINSQKLFQLFRKTRSQAIFTFFMYCGIMNLPLIEDDIKNRSLLQQNPSRFKKKVSKKKNESNYVEKYLFDHFGFKIKQTQTYYQQEEQQNMPLRISNENQDKFKVDWMQVKRFPISQKLIQTVLVKDNYNDKIVLLSQGYFNSEDSEDHFASVALENRAQFISTMKKHLLKGKKVRYLLMKRNFIPNQQSITDQQIQLIRRQDVQKKLLYAGNVIFDEWTNAQNLKVMQQLSETSFVQAQNERLRATHNIVNNPFPTTQLSMSGLKTAFLSTKQENKLNGYDHLLQDTRLLFQQSSTVRTQYVLHSKESSNGVIHVGNGILDQPSLLISDVSICFKQSNEIEQSPAQADIYIEKPAHIIELIKQGRWKLDTITLSIMCLTLINFAKIIGQSMLYVNSKLSRPSTIDSLFLDVAISTIPILLLNVFGPRKLNSDSKKRFFRVDWILSVIMCVVSLGAFYGILFMDHGFVCDAERFSQLEEMRKSKEQTQNPIVNSDIYRSINKLMTNLRHYQHESYLPSNIQSQEHNLKIFQVPRQISTNQINFCQKIIYFIDVSFAFLVILVMDHESPSRRAHIIVRHLNKLYMLGIWISCIFYYEITGYHVIRTFIIILFMACFLWAIRLWMKKQNKLLEGQESDIKAGIIDSDDSDEDYGSRIR